MRNTKIRNTRIQRKTLLAAGMTTALAMTLVSCGSNDDDGGGGGTGAGASKTNCANEIKVNDVPVVTYWGWFEDTAQTVDKFNETHDDVQICWTNAGQGADAYTKLSTSLQSKSGAPDIAQIEYDWLNSFLMQGGLVDMTEHGINEYKDNFTAGAWRDVSSGDSVYAVPVDLGPVGMWYRQDIFDKHGIPVPTTWDEYAAAAKQLSDATGGETLIGNFAPNGQGQHYAFLDQAGAKPFDFDNSNPTEISINHNDEASKKVFDYWIDLVDQDLVGTDQAWTPEFSTALGTGKYATAIYPVWYNVHIPALEGADADAVWRAAPIPQWDASSPKQVNWGGSTLAVTVQADDAALATKVAAELYESQETKELGVEVGGLFLAYPEMIESEYFQNRPYEFYGGQQLNKEIFGQAALDYEGVTFSPFTQFYYDESQRLLSEAIEGNISASDAADQLQESLETYAGEQGFELK
ncbi:ABC transporter substrate-binding protein [Arthrobacter sunyaminii]|uniref:Extracellular solute-binding protein n=1 Tax=Arthrobacter sunyaminii TaxID=2816859 RepID=A0A975S6Q7_9MICC|nr:extracellular solute-binding protein [Arthrobacter sunyaminii]MBO0907766.1 extracellular solute-binding protein [Arthrobacter sunyaminii]QWQ36828.1 extracellular solute-binding protein [Arthrobacter sunyaminii]